MSAPPLPPNQSQSHFHIPRSHRSGRYPSPPRPTSTAGGSLLNDPFTVPMPTSGIGPRPFLPPAPLLPPPPPPPLSQPQLQSQPQVAAIPTQPPPQQPGLSPSTASEDVILGPELWVHCNRCKSSAAADYWLTECGHILCQQCIPVSEGSFRGGGGSVLTIPPSDVACPVCHEICNLAPINEQLAPKIQRYFYTTELLIDEHHEIVKFQLRNSAQLIAYLKAKVERQKQVLRRAKDELLNMKELKRQVRELQAEKAQRTQRLQSNPPGHFDLANRDTLDLVANVLHVGHPARLAAHLPSLPLMYPPQFRKWT
ncbi:hypothetical protein BJ085DRAFT_34780 [Dimargaris cristalligena]|uniref:RING-type domain-containing protein n=1 Tax=Dimargaris cristalligena TaxID=215637 RepID=A0A4P9ZW31_9FUNG|nr:hypothetical protein BJ085DRAFT_34780 [Dimargaris cristalligena]|eukprot:RKP37817.1 hypothetical protein BJ085DRAFT_34780 [Dimargaris cristalligena]